MEKRILILAIRAIGDVALITPVPRLLKQHYPNSFVCILVDGASAEVLHENPYLDRIIPINRRESKKLSIWKRIREWFSLVHRLRNEKFEVVIDLFSGPRSAWLVWFCGAPHRYGEDCRASLRGYLYNHPIKIIRDNKHLVQQKLEIVEPLIGAIEYRSAELEIPISGGERQFALSILKEKGNGSHLNVAFIPGAGSCWRRWPPERFADLGNRIGKDYNARIYLLGGKEETFICQQVADLMAEKPINLSGRTTLRELIGLLSELDLVISNVTGPLHLTTAMKKPKIIGLYGTADIVQYAPWGTNAFMLTKGVASDAYWKNVDYRLDYECLLKHTVEDVMVVVRKIFRGSEVMGPQLKQGLEV